MSIKITNFTDIRVKLGLLGMLVCLMLVSSEARTVNRSALGGLIQQTTVTLVNAASYAVDPEAGVAPDSIGSLFGEFLTQGGRVYAAIPNQPLPIQLGGISVRIGGRVAPLFFVSRLQINLSVPPGLADGTNAIVVINSDNTTRSGTVKIVRSEPGIFSARSDGRGNAAALTTKDGQTFTSVFNSDGSENPIDAGSRQQLNYLVLFGTGIRSTPASNPNDFNGVAESVFVTIQGVPTPVLYAGPTPGFIGLDQVNVPLPPELSGLGTVEVKLSTPGRTANTVTIKIGGELRPINLNRLAPDVNIDGELSYDDQIQSIGSSTYFVDAYVFNTISANVTVAVDLRSNNFDAQVLLYRIENGRLLLIAQDDQTGAYGSPPLTKSYDALLVTVLPVPAQYVIIVTSSDLQPNGAGNYRLRLTPNVAPQISYGASINGRITITDYQNSSGTFFDFYWFNATTGENIQIDLGSSIFDSFLILNSQEGDPPLIVNDNVSDLSRNSRINYRISQTGSYIIVGTPLEPGVTGAYNLTLNRAASTVTAEGSSPLRIENYTTGRQLIEIQPRSKRLTRPAAERQFMFESQSISPGIGDDRPF